MHMIGRFFALLGVLFLQPVGPPRAARLSFAGVFAGVSPDGSGCLWTGAVTGASRGRLTLEIRQVEGPEDAARTVWHVVTHWSVRDSSGAHSFEAELEGMVNWRTGAAQLEGTITSGWMEGAWVEQDGRFQNGDLSGSLDISREVAVR
jgi:hypothetical protein